MNCPICKAPLVSMEGNTMHPGDSDFGITLYCNNKQCTAQEVVGHGDNARQAYDVVLAKYKPDENESGKKVKHE